MIDITQIAQVLLGTEIGGIAKDAILESCKEWLKSKELHIELKEGLKLYLYRKDYNNWKQSFEEETHGNFEQLEQFLREKGVEKTLQIVSQPRKEKAIELQELFNNKLSEVGNIEPEFRDKICKLSDKLISLIDNMLMDRIKDKDLGILHQKLGGFSNEINRIDKAVTEIKKELCYKEKKTLKLYSSVTVNTEFIEREDLLKEIITLLQFNQILTLSGSSASGKTVLAKQLVNYINSLHDRKFKAYYIPVLDLDYHLLREFLDQKHDASELMCIDFTEGTAPNFFEKKIIETIQNDIIGSKWVLFTQSNVFYSLTKFELNELGIFEKTPIPGIDLDHFWKMVDKYHDGRVTKDVVSNVYNILTANKKNGLLIKHARLLAHLDESEMIKASKEMDINFYGAKEIELFSEVSSHFPDAGRISCFIKPFTKPELEILFPEVQWGIILHQLVRKCLISLYDEDKYEMHETTRKIIYENISPTMRIQTNQILLSYYFINHNHVEYILYKELEGDTKEAEDYARQVFLNGIEIDSLFDYVSGRKLISYQEAAELLFDQRFSEARYILPGLFKECEDNGIAKWILNKLWDNIEHYEREYQSLMFITETVIDINPDFWNDLLSTAYHYLDLKGIKHFTEENQYVIDFILLGFRNKKIHLNENIFAFFELECPELCEGLGRLIFQNNFYEGFEFVFENLHKCKRYDNWNCLESIHLEVKEVFLKLIECIKLSNIKMNPAIFHFIMNHRLQFEPQCLRYIEENKDKMQESTSEKHNIILTNALTILEFYRGYSDTSKKFTASDPLQLEEDALRLLDSNNQIDRRQAALILSYICNPQHQEVLLGKILEVDNELDAALYLVALIGCRYNTYQNLNILFQQFPALEYWRIIMIKNSGIPDLKIVEELINIALNEQKKWQVRRAAIRTLACFGTEFLSMIDSFIMQKNWIFSLDTSLHQQGLEGIICFLKNKFNSLLNHNNQDDKKFIFDFYCSYVEKNGFIYRSELETEGKQVAEWLLNQLQRKPQYNDKSIEEEIIDELSLPLLQEAILWGWKHNKEREKLENVIENTHSKWLLCVALGFWDEIREDDWVFPKINVNDDLMVQRIVDDLKNIKRNKNINKEENIQNSTLGLCALSYDQIIELLNEKQKLLENQYFDKYTNKERDQIRQRLIMIKEQNHVIKCKNPVVKLKKDGYQYKVTQTDSWTSTPEWIDKSLLLLDLQDGIDNYLKIRIKYAYRNQDMLNVVQQLIVWGEFEEIKRIIKQHPEYFVDNISDIRMIHTLTEVVDDSWLPIFQKWLQYDIEFVYATSHLLLFIQNDDVLPLLERVMMIIFQEYMNDSLEYMSERSGNLKKNNMIKNNKNYRYVHAFNELQKHKRFKEIPNWHIYVMFLSEAFKGSYRELEYLDILQDVPNALIIYEKFLLNYDSMVLYKHSRWGKYADVVANLDIVNY